MKNDYTHILADGVMPNSQLTRLSKKYNLISTFNTRGKVAYVFKKKNFFSRVINKLF